MDVNACSWEPKYIVELIKSVAWPLLLLVLIFPFKGQLNKLLLNFLGRLKISEFSLGPTGATIKLEQQAVSNRTLSAMIENYVPDTVSTEKVSNSSSLPDDMSAAAIKNKQRDSQTQYSNVIFEAVKDHVSLMDITSDEKIDLLSREVSLLQSAVRYIEVNKVIFRSQFNLLYKINHNGGCISNDTLIEHFNEIKNRNKEVFDTWDYIKYISYLVTVNLISSNNDNYTITVFGSSYLTFMSKNPQMIEGLNKL
ncbi:hypothetical protein [Plesiomonas shigelloides]|uniref:hypothetical protein n=1 Tax=Plesiomonas shigelloides TaxID=703 RepID=UPI00057B4926|nr:hypothetical protein [Plesiomonas shigelloides]